MSDYKLCHVCSQRPCSPRCTAQTNPMPKSLMKPGQTIEDKQERAARLRLEGSFKRTARDKSRGAGRRSRDNRRNMGRSSLED